MKNLLVLVFALFVLMPKMSLDLGSFDWVGPGGVERAVKVELYNEGDRKREIDLEPEQIRRLFNYAWTTCDGMVDCDPFAKATFIVADPAALWLIFRVEDRGI
jgi:hypothetical protein